MTKAEREFQLRVREVGCIACIVRFGWQAGLPGDIHHLLRGGRRIGEMHVLCLCPAHHRGGSREGFVSRHPWKSAFVHAYGTEKSLLKLTQRLVSEREKLTV